MFKTINNFFLGESLPEEQKYGEKDKDNESEMKQQRLVFKSSSDKLFIGKKVFSRTFEIDSCGYNRSIKTINAYEIEDPKIYVCSIMIGDGTCDHAEKFDMSLFDKVIEMPEIVSTEGKSGDDLFVALILNDNRDWSYHIDSARLERDKKLNMPFLNYSGFESEESKTAYHDLLVFLGIREKEEWL